MFVLADLVVTPPVVAVAAVITFVIGYLVGRFMRPSDTDYGPP